MAKPNYSFEKRQRELAKKKKKEEKASRKSNPVHDAGPDDQRAPDGGEAPPAPGSASGPA